MYRNTRFGALMKALPRSVFEKIVARHGTDKHSKGFRCWDQLLALVYAQVGGCKSLREVEVGFNSQAVHHYHLGSRLIKRSTLSEANAKRSSEVFAEACGYLSAQLSRGGRREVADLLYLLDSTPIPLKGPGYEPWVQRNDRTQGLKLHLLLEAHRGNPEQTAITDPRITDVTQGREMPVRAGATYVFDKGYCDYNWWFRLHQQGAYFVSRFKRNAAVEVVEDRAVEDAARACILSDEIVQFKNRCPGGKRVNAYYGTPLRRIRVKRGGDKPPLVLVSNDLERDALALAGLYKQRWGIELFFKWVKQNLKIKQFLGRSENAVRVQIYTALITYLLAQIYRARHGLKHTLKLCLIQLRAGLFERPEIEQERLRRRQHWQRQYLQLQGTLPV